VGQPIGIGLIGLGRHGRRYAKHVLEDLPGARLAAVCRRSAPEGTAFAAERGVRFYPDYRDLIADPTVQAVVVVTPPICVRPIGLEAVRLRKPLLIEKPLATNGGEAREIVQAAEAARVPLMTAQTMRFDATVLALRDLVGSAGLRRYLSLTLRLEPRPDIWKRASDYAGRGVLLEIGIHMLDLVRYLTGEEVAEVRCDVERPGPDQPDVRAWIHLRTRAGFPCMLDVSRVSAGRVGRVEWVGAEAQIVADWSTHTVWKATGSGRVEEQKVEERPTVLATLQAFLGALERGAPMPITGLDGQRAVELVDACYRSAETSKPAKLG
jgi:predicted dehydrogenase